MTESKRDKELRKRLRSWVPPPSRVFKDRKKEQRNKICRRKVQDE